MADRRDFETILATTSADVVLSRTRRDRDGRLLGRSPLLAGHRDEAYLRRNAVPGHAFSETDRLMARPQEFDAELQAAGARACWRDWRLEEVTPHDGMVRTDHPLISAVLDRTQSASSLKALLRNPLGFVWRYAFGRKALRPAQRAARPRSAPDRRPRPQGPRTCARPAGDVGRSGAGGHRRDRGRRGRCVRRGRGGVGGRPTGPARRHLGRTLGEARALSARALEYDTPVPGAVSYGEVPFGGYEPNSDAALPWDASVPVTIPDTGFGIADYIDRLDVAADGQSALVRDYKTGKAPRDAIRLDGGRELQRCLYAFAVRQLLGEDVEISASLLYPRELLDLRLDDPSGALTEVTGYLRSARTSLAGGAALPGPDTGGDYDDLAFALPANAGATYCKRKKPAAAERMGDATLVWEAK